MDPAEVSENLFQALWNIERYVDFHANEEFRDEFPWLRTALAEAWWSTQALLPPVALFQEVRETLLEEQVETLQIHVSSIGERSVSTVNVTRLNRAPARVLARRPPRPLAPDYEFPPEALPSWTRVGRALRAHRLSRCPRYSMMPPSYEDLYPDEPPAPCRTSVSTSVSPHMRTEEIPLPSYAEMLKLES